MLQQRLGENIAYVSNTRIDIMNYSDCFGDLLYFFLVWGGGGLTFAIMKAYKQVININLCNFIM